MKNLVAYSDRTALLQVHADPVDINIIQIYALTLDKPAGEVTQMYKELKEFMKMVKKNEGIIMVGDFNGKVRPGRFENIVSDFGLGVHNRADMLIQLCQEEKLDISKTWFQLPPSGLYTDNLHKIRMIIS